MSSQLPEPVRNTMQALADGLLTVLGDRLVAVYLGGSAAMDDYEPASSDLDFMVVTDGPLSLEDELAVKLLHEELLQTQPLANRLVGDYPPRELLIPEGTAAPVPGCERGIFLPKVGEIMLTAESIWNVREYGITFYGPEPREIMPPVTPEQVRSAIQEILADGPGPCETPQELAGAMLNLLRSAYTLETGKPTTKTTGARWAMGRLDPQWHPAIRAALAIRNGETHPEGQALLQKRLPELNRMICSRCN